MKSNFLIALTQLAAERHLPKEKVLEAIEVALVSAFRKETVAAEHDLSVKLNPNTGQIRVYVLKTVVEKVDDQEKEISLKEAQKKNPDIQLSETFAVDALPQQQASRIAAQTAKQVVLQQLREMERDLIFDEYEKRVDDIVSGTIEEIESGRILVGLGRTVAVMPYEEQVSQEKYRRGQRLKVYVLEVRQASKGPEVIVSRRHHNMVKRLFELEVPEVKSGIVELKSIAREPGNRSKVAVAASQQGVDPVGSCIGMRGNRIQNIVNELHGEKIDVVRWDKDLPTFIGHALSPSEVVHVEMDETEKSAIVVVPERQLSLAIGREGQNARLAAKLSGWRLDIKSMSEWEAIRTERQPVVTEVEETVEETVPEDVPVDSQEIIAEDIPLEKSLEEDTGSVVQEEQIVEQEEERVPVSVVEESGISAEEELAALELQESVAQEESEDIQDTEIDEDVWKVPVIQSGAGQIRFAEDIMEEIPDKRTGRRKSRRKQKVRSGKKGPR
jgi:N utilization substance protein A